MLRTTITKIKRVCVLAFIPRILRGDSRYVPGQFEKLTISPIRRLKHGPETEEERCRICEKCRQLIEMAFGPEKTVEEKPDRIITTVVDEPNITQELVQTEKLAQMVAPHIHVKLETEAEKCARIIEQVFGKTEHEDKKDLVENVTSVPLDDLRLQSTRMNDNVKKLGKSSIVEPDRPLNVVEEGRTTPVPYNDEDLLIAMKKNANAYDNPTENTCESNVYATTAKENEEKLIQKIEQIDDTPLVEAPKPKLEGFNISPKVLGQQTATLNFARKTDGSKKGTSEADAYDAIASRCLNAPNKQIDERLLKELEKLGVPQPGTRAAKEPILENELVQMDVLKKPRKPVKKTEIDLETREYKREPPECFKLERMDPPFAMCEQTKIWNEANAEHTSKLERLVDHFERNLVSFDEIYTKTAELLRTTCMQQSDNSDNQSYTNLISGPRPPMDPNRVLIDPYDKKTIAYDTGECDYRDLSNLLYYDYVKPENQETGKPVVGTEIYAETPQQNDHSDQVHPTHFRPILTQDALRMVGQNYNHQYTPTDNSDPSYHTHNYESFQEKNINKHTSYKQQRVQVSPEEEVNNDVIMSLKTQKTLNADQHTLHTEVDGVAHGAYPAQDRQAHDEQAKDEHPAHIQHTHSPATNHSGYMFHQAYTTQYPYNAEATYYNAARGYNPRKAYESRHAYNHPEQAHKPEESYKTEYYTQENTPNAYFKSAHRYKPENTKESNYAQTKEHEHNYLEDAEKEYNQELNTTTDHENQEEPETIRLELSVGPEIVKGEPNLSYEPLEVISPTAEFNKLDSEIKEQQDQNDVSASQPEKIVSSTPIQQQDETSLRHMAADLDQLPKQSIINDSEVKVSLSELLRKVRERNRIELYRELSSLMLSSQTAEVEPIVGKCGKKPPPCPPPAPKCPPPDPCPPKPCPPPPPPCPKPCKPECPPPCPPKSPCAKFNNIRDTITLLFVSDPHDMPPVADLYLCETSKDGILDGAYLPDDVVTRLQTYAESLVAKCPVCKSDTYFDDNKADNEGFHYARDYTPWTPIPSWPIPKKENKQPFVCPKEGCKYFPPPRSDPPCLEKPCVGFPRRTCSQVDFFTMYLAENLVYDIGE